MKLYFAGSDDGGSYDELIANCGTKNRLKSFFYWKRPDRGPLPASDVLTDSGGFTARKMGKPINVQQFAAFLNLNKIKVAFNLDTMDVAETKANFKELVETTSTYIIPILHFSDLAQDKDFIRKTCVHPYIAVAGRKEDGRNNMIDRVFSETRGGTLVHGLGITDRTSLHRWPFYSVDSSSWLSAARFKTSRVIKDKALVHSRAENRHYVDLCRVEIKHHMEIEREATSIWNGRGIKYEEFDWARAAEYQRVVGAGYRGPEPRRLEL